WSGEAFTYEGKHYQVRNALFTPTPIQRPRIPVWVGGFWPKRGPLRRAARYDGIFAGSMTGDLAPDDLRELLSVVHTMRSQPAAETEEAAPGAGINFEVVVMNATPGDKPEEAARIVAPYGAAGATWWFEPVHSWRAPFEEMRTRIAQGPPS